MGGTVPLAGRGGRGGASEAVPPLTLTPGAGRRRPRGFGESGGAERSAAPTSGIRSLLASPHRTAAMGRTPALPLTALCLVCLCGLAAGAAQSRWARAAGNGAATVGECLATNTSPPSPPISPQLLTGQPLPLPRSRPARCPAL